MSQGYRAVGWNRQKRIYDGVVAGGVALYLGLFLGLGAALAPDITVETLLIRGFGTAAFLLLHLVLSIGPLARLDPRFLPLLYNRRHLGVVTFLLAAAHGVLSLVQFHALGVVSPLVHVLSSPAEGGIAGIPFQPLGLAALVILFLMAATSHDFWLANLTPPVWKALHMGVYLAYALVVLHVALGVLQGAGGPWAASLTAAGAGWVLGLHLVAGWREAGGDRELATEPAGDSRSGDPFVPVCRVDEIPVNRARVVTLGGERVAVFRFDGRVAALSNVCQHQNGPLGEGCVIDGLVTCPWHGFQYRPEDGTSPPPFEERVPTFRTRVRGGRVWVDPRPLAPGTRVEPARAETTPAGEVP